jgi:membrane protein DedA with SNARE-associated domain
MEEEEEESRSSFLLKNLIKGLIWLVIIIVAFIFAEEFIQNNFEKDIDVIKDQPLILFSIFFGSEVVFGIIPPVLFMTTWKLLMNLSLQEYILNLFVLTVLSFIAGVIGYFIGKFFSTTRIYKRISYGYLRQYNRKLKKYGSFLVLVGALTPVPFSATCMMAGSVAIPFKDFLWVCASRVLYFLIYGWIVWAFPNLFV